MTPPERAGNPTMSSSRLTNLYAALGELNEAIVRSSDRQSLFEQACAIAVRQGHFRSALLWWINPEAPTVAERAAFATYSNLQINPRASIDLNAPESYSPTICALAEGKIDTCNDIRNDPRIHWHPSSTAWRGIDSCAAFPLRENGRLAGALSLYASQTGAFDPDAVNLLTRIAADLSYALDDFVREAERQKMEAALRQREYQLRTITDGLPALVSYMDTEMRYRFLNRAYETFYGRPREEMLGRKVSEVMETKDLELMRSRLGVTGKYTPGAGRRYLRTLHDHTGAERHFQTQTIPDIDSNGKELGRFILSMEITELRRAEQALQESEERFQLAVRGSSDGIWDFNLKTGLRYYSPRFKRILGYADEELPGSYEAITALMTPEDRDGVDKALRHHLFARAPFDIECRMHHREGHWIWIRFRGQAQWDENGRATRVAGSATDITDRKQIEEKLRQLAHFDNLTGLPNRVMLMDRIEQALLQARRNKWLVGVLFLDLNRFKAVNDTLGHAAGDELLRQVAVRLGTALRAGDTVGRLGGDEFAVLLPDLGKAETAQMVARKIAEKLNVPFQIQGTEVSIGTSIGIAVSPQDSESPEELLKKADAAMYQDKQAGRQLAGGSSVG